MLIEERVCDIHGTIDNHLKAQACSSVNPCDAGTAAGAIVQY
jgi:hypothetical protein